MKHMAVEDEKKNRNFVVFSLREHEHFISFVDTELGEHDACISVLIYAKAHKKDKN